MDFLELARDKRFSVRKFQEKLVEEEKLLKVLEAGRVSPTATNAQPQRIIVVKTEEGLEKIKKSTKYHFNAPIILIIAYDQEESFKNPYSKEDYGVVDGSIVITQMMLEAASQGLGTTFVGHYDPQVIKEEFSLPENIRPMALLPIGYPEEGLKPAKAHWTRKDISETVFFEKYKD